MSKHAVVDGSNIATECRSEPSLKQLREAVAAFKDEYAFDIVTVIVDASFEHRVAKSEQKAARAAIDANEIITPPAGVIGRGDTFILQVADRAGAVVLSNDSFQEFHGEFVWLFDEGRLIGGKPIPGLGWVYVPRAPVRGPVSRRARANADKDEPKKAAVKKTAVKKAAVKKTAVKKAVKKLAMVKRDRPAKTPDPTGPGANPHAAWDAFRKRHPVGSRVKATVDEFSSHGAYATAGETTIYLPLRLMGDPAPRRARDVVTVGQTRRFVIHRYDEERQGIDAGIIPFRGSSDQTDRPTESSGKRSPRKGATVAAKKAAKKATKKSAKKTPAKKAPAKKAAKKAPAKKAAAKKAPAKKAARKAPAKKAAAKKAPAKKATAKKAPAKKAPAKKAPAKKAGAKKAAKKAPAKKAKKAARKRR